MYFIVENIKQMILLMENEEGRLMVLECLNEFMEDKEGWLRLLKCLKEIGDGFNNIVDELLKWEEEGFQDDREKTF